MESRTVYFVVGRESVDSAASFPFERSIEEAKTQAQRCANTCNKAFVVVEGEVKAMKEVISVLPNRKKQEEDWL